MCQVLCHSVSHVIAFTSHNNHMRQGLLVSLHRCKNPGLGESTSSKLLGLHLACTWPALGGIEGEVMHRMPTS